LLFQWIRVACIYEFVFGVKNHATGCRRVAMGLIPDFKIGQKNNCLFCFALTSCSNGNYYTGSSAILVNVLKWSRIELRNKSNTVGINNKLLLCAETLVLLSSQY
jgi:hypothetical protein